MGVLRGVVRGLALVGVTVLLYLAYLVSRLAHLVSASAARTSHHFLVRTWARLCCAILGVEISVRGEPPRAPFFLVANHLSYLDILVLFTRVDGFFLAKSEIASWPLVGLLARSTGTLFVDRARRSDLVRVNAEARGVLRAGGGMITFPEGTSTAGAEVQRFKPSIFEVAMRTGVPVSCATLHYATTDPERPAYLSVCWWGEMTFFGHFLRLLTLPRIESRVTFDSEAIRAHDRKQLAHQARTAVERNFSPLTQAREALRRAPPETA